MGKAIDDVTADVLPDFADAWNRHDIDALMSFLTGDCVFASSAGPDVCGARYAGREAVRASCIALALLCSGVHLTACRSCSEENSSSMTTSSPLPPIDAPNAKIWVSKTGAIEVNGSQVEVESVGPMLAELAQRKGEVFYGREAAEEDPHPNGLKVLQMVITSGLPVRMSTKRDFSDAVRLDGTPKK